MMKLIDWLIGRNNPVIRARIIHNMKRECRLLKCWQINRIERRQILGIVK